MKLLWSICLRYEASVELLPKIVGLDITKTLLTLGTPGYAWRQHLLPPLEISFQGRYGRRGSVAGAHQCIPLVFSESLLQSALLPHCITPMHVKMRYL